MPEALVTLNLAALLLHAQLRLSLAKFPLIDTYSTRPPLDT